MDGTTDMPSYRIWWAFIVAGVLGSSGCEGGAPPVSFSTDVQPILAQHCLDCHRPGGDGYDKSGFGVESYVALMKGTKFGPVVLPGNSFNSNLIVLVEGRADPSITMPHEGPRLSEDNIETLKAWIDQGALDD